MKDVSEKSPTLRTAVAEAFITMPVAIQTMLREARLEKGDALEIARVAWMASGMVINASATAVRSVGDFSETSFIPGYSSGLRTSGTPSR